jgi:flagellin
MAAINTNMISLNAQRNLGVTQSSLALSIQRLSSGLRVNSAKDDAAGLAIAERMNSQVRGMNVAIRNANDGISLAQTAEGALGKIGDMLQRMRELSVQSANATNSADDRAALDKEVQSLKSEIGRMASTTSFNGVKILDGSFSARTFQVGASSASTDRITVSDIANAQTSELGKVTSATVTVDASAFDADDRAAGDFTITSATGTSTINLAAATTNAQRAEQIVTAINADTDKTGVSAFYDADQQKLTVSSGIDFTLAEGTAEGTPLGAAIFGAALTAQTATTGAGMSGLKIDTAQGAIDALKNIDAAISTISTNRAAMGALQSRFESVIGNLQISSENIAAARGRIMDTDFAAETANLSRAQVLQQAGMAMLSQANAVPQNVLSLLR